MATCYLPGTELRSLLQEQEGTRAFAPTETPHLAWLDVVDADSCIAALAQSRSAQSPKGFFLPAAESLGRYGVEARGGRESPPGDLARASPQAATAVAESQPLVLIGVRACELRARNYLDKVMLEGAFADELYRRRRQSTTIVSCDCVDCTDSCFCTLVGGQPFCSQDYDVNLTPIDGGYVVEVATDRGRQWLGESRLARLAEATPEQVARRDQLRLSMVERVTRQNAAFHLAASDQSQPKLPNDGHEAWQKFAADCVECGACTHICPTCHCFYLYDQICPPGPPSAAGEGAPPSRFERIRAWDSCLFSTYDRMAGGVGLKLTPRPHLFSRLANRVLHKFAYSPQQYNLLGCVGCGRCVEACLGSIDIRQVVQELGE